MSTVGEELLKALKQAGAKAAFGIPGDYVLPFFRVMEQSGILPLYTMGHEPAVGFAADGAARQGGGVGVAVVTYGAGAMNMVNAAACAWAECSPLVIVSGAPGRMETERGLMLHHQIRTMETQMNVFREFTCDQARLDEPEKAGEVIGRVLGNCLRQSRPVYIEFPRDMPMQACAARDYNFDNGAQSVLPGTTLRDCLADIGERLAAARAPAILAGSQVRRFGQEETLFRAAEAWNVPLLNTFMGKGLFAGRSWPYAGSYLGLAGSDETRGMVEDADFLLMAGVILCDTNFGVSGRRIDEAKTVFMTPESTVVCGREYAGVSLRLLLPYLKQLQVKKTSSMEGVPRETGKYAADVRAHIMPDDLAHVVQDHIRTMSAGPLIVADVGDCLFTAMSLEGGGMLASGYYATMGFAVPAAMGAQAVTGERPIVIVGDGGFQMTGWELINCARYGLNPVVILMNNGSWEMLNQFDHGARYTRLADIGYAQMMERGGCHAAVARSPAELDAALKRAEETTDAPFLIEVKLPSGVCSSMMQRYTAAIRGNMLK